MTETKTLETESFLQLFKENKINEVELAEKITKWYQCLNRGLKVVLTLHVPLQPSTWLETTERMALEERKLLKTGEENLQIIVSSPKFESNDTIGNTSAGRNALMGGDVKMALESGNILFDQKNGSRGDNDKFESVWIEVNPSGLFSDMNKFGILPRHISDISISCDPALEMTPRFDRNRKQIPVKNTF